MSSGRLPAVSSRELRRVEPGSASLDARFSRKRSRGACQRLGDADLGRVSSQAFAASRPRG
eukprot:11789990-Heterocapsa_arctica.AAC.1